MERSEKYILGHTRPRRIIYTYIIYSKNNDFRNIYFSLVVFKNEFDMIKVFNVELFQAKIDEEFKYDKLKQDADGKDKYLHRLLGAHEVHI